MGGSIRRRHFKDVTCIWEIGNEWIGSEWNDQIVERYMRVFEKTYEAIKNVDPDGQIMPGALLDFAPELIRTLLGGKRKSGMQNGKLVANGGNFSALETSTLVIAE